MVFSWIRRHYPAPGLWPLFLMCSLPLHAWTLILAFRDLSWLADRTNAWDAIGVLCYGLLFALGESLIVFVFAALLGLLVSDRWEAERRTSVLALAVLVLSLWAMAGQLFFLTDYHVPGNVIDFLVRAGHPVRTMYLILVPVVGATFLAPTLLVLRSGRAQGIANGAIQRLSLLAMLYLVLDALALVVVVVRNV